MATPKKVTKGQTKKGVSPNYTTPSVRKKGGSKKTPKKATTDPTPVSCCLPDPEAIPVCPEGTACVLGRDKDQNLVCYQIPAADKIVRSKADGTAIYFSNT